jgi:hypothetical protein
MIRASRRVSIIALLACCGCAVRRPALQPWRLIKQNADEVLVPPDVTAADLAQRTFKADVTVGQGPCPATEGVIAIKVRGKHAYVTVARDGLAAQAPGWLQAWATQLEEQRCVAPGEGMKLAARIAESVPLNPRTALNLLYSNDLNSEPDLSAYSRLRVVSPLWQKPGVRLMAEGPYTVEGQYYTLTVTGKSTDNLAGYETTIYAIRRNARQDGYTIAPIYTDRHVEGKTERRPGPAVNYLHLPTEAAFYRLFYKSWKNDFTAVLVGARNPAELDERVKVLQASGASASCDTLHHDMCVTLPKDVGVISLISVTVNGTDLFVSRGIQVFDAIRTDGEPVPRSVLPNLEVFKPWNGRLVAVAFDHTDDGILRLVLQGGEIISWH